MGSSISTFFRRRMFEKPEIQVMMIGLDAAGKTTILFKLKLGLFYATTPTIGFNVESLEYKNVRMTVWDVGGQEKIRPLWRKCWNNIQAVIYVIDSADRERIDEAGHELRRVLQEEYLRDAILLVLANKQDQYRRMTPEEVTRRLGLQPLHRRKWHLQGCSALTGDGLNDGLCWLDAQFRKPVKK